MRTKRFPLLPLLFGTCLVLAASLNACVLHDNLIGANNTPKGSDASVDPPHLAGQPGEMCGGVVPDPVKCGSTLVCQLSPGAPHQEGSCVATADAAVAAQGVSCAAVGTEAECNARSDCRAAHTETCDCTCSGSAGVCSLATFPSCCAFAGCRDLVAVADAGTADSGADSSVYRAFDLFTNVPRFAIYKADPTRNICVRIILEMGGSDAGPGLSMPPGWSVESAVLTNAASDCPNVAGPPPPAVGATSVPNAISGAIASGPGAVPCKVSVHATLSFAPSMPWVPATERLDADNLRFDASCP